MGGQGSGRPPSVETIIKRNQPVVTPVGNDLFLPNYSGIQKAALKTSPDLSGSGVSDHSALSNLDYASAGHTGFQPAGSYLTSETDPIFMSLSGSLPYEATLTKGNLTASGSGVTIYGGTGSIIGAGVQIAVDGAGAETDPVFMSLSGSLPYVVAETDPVFMSLSGSFLKTESDPVFMSLSGSLPYEATLSKGNLTASGSNVTVYGGTNAVIGAGSQISVTETDPVFMALSGGFAVSSKGVTNGDSHDHSGGDGGQINHTTLSNIGTNTHAQIDSHISDTSDPHGATLTQTTLYGTTVSGANIYGTTGVWGTTVSGANIYGTTGVWGATVSGTNTYATTLMKAPTIYATTALSGAACNATNITGETIYGTTKLSGAACTATDITGATLYATTKLSGAACNAATISGTNIYVGTSISGALFMTTTDSTTSGAERMRNILVGTEAATALSAAQYIQGTIYLKYTA